MNVLIVEDEPAAVQRMRKLLAQMDPAIVVVGATDTITATVKWLENNEAPDLAFFDIQLADGDSFEVFARTNVPCPVIFTTAYDEHALKAFKVNAIDYLLKPIKPEELDHAILRAKHLRVVRDHKRPDDAQDGTANAFIKRFLIRYGDKMRVVEPKDIAYIHSLQKNTFLRTTEGRDLPLDESLDRLEKQLDPQHFFRVNRQLLAHFQSIGDLTTHSKSRVKVKFTPPYDQDAVVSSEKSADFKRWLAGR